MLEELDHAFGPRSSQDRLQEALDSVVRNFADAIEADATMLLASPGGGESPRILAAWDRSEPPLEIPWTEDGLIARALEANGALVEPGRAGTGTGGNGALMVARIAAPVRSAGRGLGAIHAGFRSPSGSDAGRLCRIAETYARIAGLCLAGHGSSAGNGGGRPTS